ncbi:hypothetical protein ABFX02_06G201827 [Erythranthe guttata]
MKQSVIIVMCTSQNPYIYLFGYAHRRTHLIPIQFSNSMKILFSDEDFNFQNKAEAFIVLLQRLAVGEQVTSICQCGYRLSGIYCSSQHHQVSQKQVSKHWMWDLIKSFPPFGFKRKRRERKQCE